MTIFFYSVRSEALYSLKCPTTFGGQIPLDNISKYCNTWADLAQIVLVLVLLKFSENFENYINSSQI